MSFESRLDKFWENQPRKYNYSHEIVINTTGHDLNITRLDEELTEESSSGDLQSEFQSAKQIRRVSQYGYLFS